MTRSVRELLTLCVFGKRPEQFVFTRENGEPVREFRRTWQNACVRAGVGNLLCPTCKQAVNSDKRCTTCARDWRRHQLKYAGLYFHDLRRTGVRNMVRAGVTEKVAMTISGHRTRSTFERYNIVAPSDLADAARKLEMSQGHEREALEKSGVSEFGQSSGIVAPKTGHAHEAIVFTPRNN